METIVFAVIIALFIGIDIYVTKLENKELENKELKKHESRNIPRPPEV